MDAMSSRRYQIGQLRIATVSPLRKRTYASSSLLSNAAGWKVPSSKLAAMRLSAWCSAPLRWMSARRCSPGTMSLPCSPATISIVLTMNPSYWANCPM